MRQSNPYPHKCKLTVILFVCAFVHAAVRLACTSQTKVAESENLNPVWPSLPWGDLPRRRRTRVRA
eukprot:scaffold184442_cov24-Tisochrysis_lutea.AAC.1